MQGAFFYSSILAFASGIFVRSFFITGWVVIVWICLVTFVLGLWWFKNRQAKRAPYLLLVVVSSACFTFGLARLELVTTLAPASALVSQIGQKVELTGIVVTEPEVTAKSTRLVVAVAHERVLVSADRYADIRYGDEVTFKGKLAEPEAFGTEFGRTFNYPGYLAVRDIFYTVSFAQVNVVSQHNGNYLLDFLFRIKKVFLESLQTYIPEPEVGLGAGLLLGVKSSLGSELEAAFRTTGIIHIVVLSGANIMLVVLFVMYILSLFLTVRVRAVVGVVTIILFTLLVGFSATVVRASIMATLVMVSLLLGRRYVITRALFFAGGVMLIGNPSLLVYDIGFQLSFMATLGLITVAPQFELYLSGVPAHFKLKEFFLATMSTQIAILPLLLYQIGQFSVVAVLVNMLVLPLVPVAMLTTFITGVLGLVFPTLAGVVGVGAYFTLAYIIQTATWFAALPYAAFMVPAFPFYFVAVAYMLIGFVLYLITIRARPTAAVVDTSSIDNWTVIEEVEDGEAESGRERSSRPETKVATLPIFFR